MTALEERLSRLDLRLESMGAHLADERLACVAQGAEPTTAEAGHLAGCDDCTELLMAVGVGLEGALVDLPGAESWVHAPQTPPATGASWGVLMGGSALFVSAAALWIALGTGDSIEPTPVPTRVVEAPAPSSPSSITVEATPLRSGHTAPSTHAPVDQLTVRRAVEQPPSDAPPVKAIASGPMTPKPPRSRSNTRKTAVQAPGATAVPRGEMRVRGPRPLEARPVDAPPRGSGYLRLAAKPPAKVFIDGKLIGWTPLVDHRLLEGPHDVRLQYVSDRARLREERFRVVIEPDRIWRSLRRNLRPTKP